MNRTDAVKSITTLRNNAAEVVRDAAESGRRLVLTQNGEAKAGVMGVAQYTDWKRALALLKSLAQREADIGSKRIVDQTDAFRRAKMVCDALQLS